MTTVIAYTPRPNKLQMLRLSLVPGLRWRAGSLPANYRIDCTYIFLIQSEGQEESWIYLREGMHPLGKRPELSFKDFLRACYEAMKPASWEQEDI